jgi:hypothetical protein
MISRRLAVMSDSAVHGSDHEPVDVAGLSPDDPSYVGNLAVHGEGGRVHLPPEFVRVHRLAEDQVEAYWVGDALILLPDRHREAASRYLSEVLTADAYSEDVRPADADDA